MITNLSTFANNLKHLCPAIPRPLITPLVNFSSLVLCQIKCNDSNLTQTNTNYKNPFKLNIKINFYKRKLSNCLHMLCEYVCYVHSGILVHIFY